MLGVGYQLPLCSRSSTEFFNQFPMVFAREDPMAILQCCQGVNHRECLMKRRGGRRKARMGHDADEGNSDECRQGKGFFSISQALDPRTIEFMAGILSTVGVNQNVNIGHLHRKSPPLIS